MALAIAEPPAPSYSAPLLGLDLSNSYAAPESSYGAPSQGPQSSYGAPASAPGSSYGAPASAPGPSYGAPASAPGPSYGAPAPAPGPSYGAPAGPTVHRHVYIHSAPDEVRFPLFQILLKKST
ncbi:unnamed protein product [Orchesella dallaii]|uniref:Mucin-like domain-containing protein n=1 Tax=Orchesella dallaii TaxID=48710 RepID=A0ABP1RFH0_9HEXA